MGYLAVSLLYSISSQVLLGNLLNVEVSDTTKLNSGMKVGNIISY